MATPNGNTIAVPATWQARSANNGKGIIYQRPGAAGDAYSVRIMEPTSRYPEGYAVFYNGYGQPIDLTGKPGSRATSHIPLGHIGPLPPLGWPSS